MQWNRDAATAHRMFELSVGALLNDHLPPRCGESLGDTQLSNRLRYVINCARTVDGSSVACRHHRSYFSVCFRRCHRLTRFFAVADVAAEDTDRPAAPSDAPDAPAVDLDTSSGEAAPSIPTGGMWSANEDSIPARHAPATSSHHVPTLAPVPPPTDAFGRPLAGWWRRVAGFAIDIAILTAVSVALWIVFWIGGLATFGDWIIGAINIAYFTFTIGSSSGQTPGMKVTGIAVSDATTGRSPTYAKAFARYLVMAVFSAMVYIGLLVDCLWALYDERRQALHDKAVGTLVVEVRHGLGVAPGSVGAPVSLPGGRTAGGRRAGTNGHWVRSAAQLTRHFVISPPAARAFGSPVQRWWQRVSWS